MQETDTYLAIVDEGKEKQAKKYILLAGEERHGAADKSVRNRLESITDLERLDRLMHRALRGANWQEILDTP